MLTMERNVGRRARINKGGRPKKPRFEADFGTVEIQTKRILALGGKPKPVYANDGQTVLRVIDGNADTRGTDATLAWSPIGVYLANGDLDPDPEVAKQLYDMALYFRWAYGVMFGRSNAKTAGGDGSRSSNEERDEKTVALVELVYKGMADALRAQAREAFDAVWNVCVADKLIGPWHLAWLRVGLKLIKSRRARIISEARTKLAEQDRS